jgi:hypothetical protein
MKESIYFGIILIIVIIINIFVGSFLIEGYTTMATKYAYYKNKKEELMRPSYNITADSIKYNATDYNDMIDTTQNDITTGNAYVIDKTRNMVALSPSGLGVGQSGLGVTPTYYKPGSYKFGASTYLPNYEDSIYLSQTTGESTVTPILNQASISKGFCSYYANQPDKLEEACMITNPNNCASTSCCVLLGGSKCVSGNKQGPYMKENYGDTTILNRDYYYYKGKCYGNCPGTTLTYNLLDPNKISNISNISNIGSDLLNNSKQQSEPTPTPTANEQTTATNKPTPTANEQTTATNEPTTANAITSSNEPTTANTLTSSNEPTTSSEIVNQPNSATVDRLVNVTITQPINTTTTIANQESETI